MREEERAGEISALRQGFGYLLSNLEELTIITKAFRRCPIHIQSQQVLKLCVNLMRLGTLASKYDRQF